MDSENKLGRILQEKHLTISCVESLTGGLFASYITSFSGASNYFKGGMVTYQNEIKEKLGVSKKALLSYGAVSSLTATEMAEHGQNYFGSDICVSFTGNAGPTSLEDKPVGLVYIGICYKGTCFVYSNIFEGDRNKIREKCIEFAVETISSLIEDIK